MIAMVVMTAMVVKVLVMMALVMVVTAGKTRLF